MSTEEQATTQEIVELDRRHHLHPYQVFDMIASEGALPIAAGDGAFLTDMDGNRYLDAVGGMWCTNIGLGNEEMAEAIAEQLETLYDLPMVGDVRGSHLMACIEFVADKETHEVYPPEIGIGKRVSNECDAIGLIVRPVENLNVMSPPLVITKDDVDFMVSALREAIPKAHAKAEEDLFEMRAGESSEAVEGQ